MVLHQFFPRHQTGVEVVTRALARELDKTHQVTLFYREHNAGGAGPSPPALEEERTTVEGLNVVRVRRIGPRPLNPLRVFLDYYYNPDIQAAFERLLDDVKPDIVHIQHLMYLSAGIIGATARRGIPTVLSLHDYWYICPNAQLVRPSGRICQGTTFRLRCSACAGAAVGQPMLLLLSPLLSLLFRHRARYLRRQLAQATVFLSPSHFLKGVYASRGFPEERMLVVENGIDTSGLVPRRKRSGSAMRFAYLGSLAWQKGVHTLVRAFNQMPDGAELMIYGDPAVFPAYAERLRGSAEHGGIHFAGQISHEQVWQALSETDVLVVPSLWYENSPTVILEASAAGVPVIASRIGALAEKVRDGVDGLHFEPGDAADLSKKMLSLAANPASTGALRSNIRPVASVEQQAKEVELIYRRLLDGKGPA